jgi:tetratricopeptide (TPR) repeat protein
LELIPGQVLNQQDWKGACELLGAAITHEQTCVEGRPGYRDYRDFLANHYDLLSTALVNLRKFPEAERALDLELAEREKLVVEFPQVVGYKSSLATCLYNRGNLFLEEWRLPEAEANYRKSVKLLKELTDKFPDTPTYQSIYGATLHNLALVLQRRGEWDEAVQLTDQAVEHQQIALKPNPGNQVYRERLFNHYMQLGYYLANFPDCPLRDTDPPLRDSGRAIDQIKMAIDLDPRNGTAQVYLGVAYYRNQDFSNSVATLLKVLDFNRKDNAREGWFFLAMACWRLGQKERARMWYYDAAAWLDKNPPGYPENVLRVRAEAAALLGVEKESSPTLGPDFPPVADQFDRAVALYDRGINFQKDGHSKEAEAQYRAALGVAKELTSKFPTEPDYHSLCGATLHNLALLLERREKWAEAFELVEHALDHQQAAFDSNRRHEGYREYLCNHCTVLACYLANSPLSRLRNPVRAIPWPSKHLRLIPRIEWLPCI